MRILVPILLLATPAAAAERTVGIGSFNRLRVDGALEVRVATGVSPAARITGGHDTIDSIDIRQDGQTLVIRPGVGVWGTAGARTGARDDAPPVVTLGTGSLSAIASVAGARITAAAANGERIDLSVSGAGAIAVADSAASDLNATVIGAGTIAIAGRATRARLIVNGPGAIDAAALDAGDLTARLDGVGAITAQARYTATGSNTGLGTIRVAGSPKCAFRTPAGSRIDCGGH